MQPHDVIHATAKPIGDIGAAFYFVPETVEYGKQQLGIDGFRFYFCGRGGVLGDVDAGVVRAAFGYFEPGLLRKMWETGIERSGRTPREIAREFIGRAHEFGRSRLAGVDGLDGFVDAASAVIAAMEGASLPLFSAVRAEPVPDDVPAAAYHQAMVLREMRGSTHLLAIVASGLASAIAHAIRRPTEGALFGYGDDTLPQVSDADRAAWARAEALTDELLLPAFAALTATQGDALVAGTQAMHAALAG